MQNSEWSGGLSGTLSKKCLGCAGNLTFDANIGALVCHMCGKVYDSKSMEEKGSFALAFREKEYEEGEDVAAEDLDKVEFVCDSCGAQVVTDTNTTATFCSFCGSPTLISRRLTRQFKPDMIIPFSISKEKAMSLYDEFLETADKVPKDFSSAKVRERIKGIYMPAWLVSGELKTDITATGIRMEDGIQACYDLNRTLAFSLENIPFSGSKKLGQRMFEAVEPFNMKEATDFKTAYLQGFYAYKYDSLPENMIDKIETRIDDYGRECGKKSWDGKYDVASDHYQTALTGVNVKYCLVPVWFMCYEYEGLYYHFVVNGQTGEVCGRLPRKESLFGKAVAKFGKITPVLFSVIAAFLIGLLFMVYVTVKSGGNTPMGSLMWWLLFLYSSVVSLAITLPTVYIFFYKRYINKQLKKSSERSPYELDRRPPVEQYFALNGKIEIEKNDRFATALAKTKVGENETRYTML